MENTLGNWVRKIGSSLFFVGYFPWGSGTVGSAITVAGLWYASTFHSITKHPQFDMLFWVGSCVMAVIAMFLSSNSKEVFGQHDSPKIIIDEVAGQMITFLFIPLSLQTLIAGFLLFRFYDIIKPYPVHNVEELESGVGVTMDDVVAGIMANLSLLVIIGAYHYVKRFL